MVLKNVKLFYTFFTNYLSQKGFCAPSVSVAGEGTRSEGSEPMRNGGLDPGSAMGEDRDDETLSGFDQQIEHNVVDSPGTTEELLHQQRVASVKRLQDA